MDLPILKHLDTLIGLAVVMLVASTVIVAVTQLVLSMRRARSLYLRETLTDLVSQLAPKLDAKSAHYVAERLLRHPLVGRNGWVTRLRNDGKSGLPFPKVARGEVILRHEIIVSLLEWAAVDGPLTLQDRAIAPNTPEAAGRLQQLVESLREALREAGVADPSAALRDVRRNFVEFESANPEQPSQVWHTQAIVKANLGDLTGKIFAAYDNSMERVTEFFSLEAKVVTSVIGLILCFVIQLDSVGLLRRLSTDEKLRAALVAQAETAKKAYEQTQATPAERAEAEKLVRESVEQLRDPKVAAIPDYLVWENVTQLRIPKTKIPSGKIVVKVNAREYPVEIPAKCGDDFPHCPTAQFENAALPIEVYPDADGLTLVARSKDVYAIQLGGLEDASYKTWDSIGLYRRFPGLILSWILLSLGAPFWYDLLKKLLGLRSILQSKDDAERETRAAKQDSMPAINQPPASTSPAELPLQGQPAGVVLNRTASLRAQPSVSAPFSRELPEGYLVNVEGFVEGPNGKWHRTVQGDFLSDGDVKAEANVNG